MKYNIEELNKIIRNRRSIKPLKMKPTPIADTIIETLLENANWAPTHGLTEPWRFKLFSGESRKKLAEFQTSLYKKKMSEDKFKQAKYERLGKNPLNVSHVIALCMKRQESEKLPEIEELLAVACAVQNIHLSATCYGIGALWSSGFPTYEEELKPFLGLNEKDKCLGFLYLGYPEGEWPEAKRASVQEKTEWI